MALKMDFWCSVDWCCNECQSSKCLIKRKKTIVFCNIFAKQVRIYLLISQAVQSFSKLNYNYNWNWERPKIKPKGTNVSSQITATSSTTTTTSFGNFTLGWCFLFHKMLWRSQDSYWLLLTVEQEPFNRSCCQIIWTKKSLPAWRDVRNPRPPASGD